MSAREPIEEEYHDLGDHPRFLAFLILLFFVCAVGSFGYCLWVWGGGLW